MGRILRIGTDALPNYSFLKTSAYDALAPAATTAAWSDSLAMDQPFDQPDPTTVAAEGVLVVFERLPDVFLGALVKLEPTYDISIGENPVLEMWTHDIDAAAWTIRSRIVLSNIFEGIPTGTRKLLDFTLASWLRNVDQVWLTMAPGATGSPTLSFVLVQLFGKCEGALPKGKDPEDPCADPNDPLYTGLDDEGNPCPGTEPFPVPTDTLCIGFDTPGCLDICNLNHVAEYAEWASTIPGYREVFDAWYNTYAPLISLACNAVGDPDDVPPQPPLPPAPPPALDLCDQDSIDAFRAFYAGDAELLANFDAYIDSLTADGFFDFTCPVEEPPEEYIDPVTLLPADEPTGDPTGPFGRGPGGEIPPMPPPDEGGGGGGGSEPIQEYIVFMFNSSSSIGAQTEQEYFESNMGVYPLEIQDAWARRDAIVTEGGWNTFTKVAQFAFSGAITNAVIGIRVHEIWNYADFSALIFSGATQNNCAVNTQSGTFGTQTPEPSDPFFVIRRDGGSTTANLRISQEDATNTVMPGSFLSRWLCCIIRATPEVAGTITVVPSIE